MLCVLMVAAIGWSHSGTILFAATGLYRFLWMFAPPFQLPLLMLLDPGNRAALFVSPAQLVGLAVGPAVAALSVGIDPRGPAIASIALFAISILLLMLASLVRKNAVEELNAAMAARS